MSVLQTCEVATKCAVYGCTPSAVAKALQGAYEQVTYTGALRAESKS